MADRYEAKCKVCGTTEEVNSGWCKLILYDNDYNKTTEWLCGKHYQEFLAEQEAKRLDKCPDHPRYQGKRKPRADCLVCDAIWVRKKS